VALFPYLWGNRFGRSLHARGTVLLYHAERKEVVVLCDAGPSVDVTLWPFTASLGPAAQPWDAPHLLGCAVRGALADQVGGGTHAQRGGRGCVEPERKGPACWSFPCRYTVPGVARQALCASKPLQ